MGVESTHVHVVLRQPLLEDRTISDVRALQTPVGEESHPPVSERGDRRTESVTWTTGSSRRAGRWYLCL